MFHLVIAGIDGYDGGRDAAAFARALEPEELHLVSAYPVDSTRTRAALRGYDELIQLFCAESAIKRPNTVEEVAAVAVLLASDAARNITGCMFPIDGGTMPY